MQNNQENKLILLEDLGMIYNEKLKKNLRFGLYKCYCGNEFKTQTSRIKSGNTKSCGCYHNRLTKERFTTHGLAYHRLYKVWAGIIQRCTNKNHTKYEYYGERGINVCDEWLDFIGFHNDMFPTYMEGMTIDRIDVNGNYSKDNCRWATKTIQSRNTRRIHKTNTSGYRGVSFDKNRNKWLSSIRVNGKSKHLGRFQTPLEAAKAYDNYVLDNNLEHTRNFN